MKGRSCATEGPRARADALVTLRPGSLGGSRCNQRQALPASGLPRSPRNTVARTHESFADREFAPEIGPQTDCSPESSRICACPLLLRGASVGHDGSVLALAITAIRIRHSHRWRQESRRTDEPGSKISLDHAGLLDGAGTSSTR
jgi:hypothetical protein